MAISFRLVSILCLVDAVVLLFFNTYFPLNPDGVQPLWDYLIDPVTLAIMALVIYLNIRASIQAHQARQERHPLPAYRIRGHHLSAQLRPEILGSFRSPSDHLGPLHPRCYPRHDDFGHHFLETGRRIMTGAA